MSTEDAVLMVVNELNKARSRYPQWPDNIVMAAAIANEESGEVVKACNNYYWRHGEDMPDDIAKEAIQAAAMWIRFLVDTPVMNGYADRYAGDCEQFDGEQL